MDKKVQKNLIQQFYFNKDNYFNNTAFLLSGTSVTTDEMSLHQVGSVQKAFLRGRTKHQGLQTWSCFLYIDRREKHWDIT